MYSNDEGVDCPCLIYYNINKHNLDQCTYKIMYIYPYISMIMAIIQ